MTDRRSPKLYRSSDDKKITGLCGGIAEYFETDASLIRLAWIVITILTGVVPGVAAYLLASIVIPIRPIEQGGTQGASVN